MLNEAEERVRAATQRGFGQLFIYSFECLHLSHATVSRPAVQRPDEEEEDRGERQSKNLADHRGAGPEEERGSQPGMAEGPFSFSKIIFSP